VTHLGILKPSLKSSRAGAQGRYVDEADFEDSLLSSSAGLSLLEVLAAAMIFAMVMTVLISTSSTAVFHIGASVRRLEASMLADRILADLEIEMKQGIAPEPTDEFEQDPYTIRIGRIDLTQDIGAHDPNNGESIIVSTFGAELPEVLNHLRRYDIEVSWMEQSGPQSVTRISFAFDWQNARTEFSTLFTPSTPSAADGDVSDENGTEEN
jgi:hypothetical protein